MFPDEMMFVITLLAIPACLYYGKRKRDYLVAVWALPLAWLAIFYGILALNVETVEMDMQLRLALYRPGQFFLTTFILIFALNGHVNNAIDRIVRRLEDKWKISSNRQ